MKEINQSISGSNNVQIVGDYIITSKHTTKIEVMHNPDLHISDAEARMIVEKINEVVNVLSKNDTDKKKLYPQIYNALKTKFHCNKYSLIPKGEFNNAIKFLSKYKGMNFSKSKLTQLQRVDRYKAIHAKCHELNISDNAMHQLINDYLSHKKTYNSLTELSDTSLNNVYYYFIKMKKVL